MSHNRSIRNINCLHQKKQKEILTNEKDHSSMLKMYTDLGRCVSNFVFLLWPVSMLLLLHQKDLIIFVLCVYGTTVQDKQNWKHWRCRKMYVLRWCYLLQLSKILQTDTKMYSFIIWEIMQYERWNRTWRADRQKETVRKYNLIQDLSSLTYIYTEFPANIENESCFGRHLIFSPMGVLNALVSKQNPGL